ncbi:purine permease 1-like [Magnolia sinica]|uniref:purine permease 1-like n=1 Tax=Magnolia sinica TaxID=86752 RepID=UPI00265B1656|nr:purine permease 1-like [Magnolia sinica]
MSSMNVETIEGTVNERSSGGDQPSPTGRRGVKWGLLLICITFMGIGMIGGPVLQRLYFLHGGNRKWLSSCLQTIGFPIMFLPLLVLYWKNLRLGKSKPFIIKPKLFMAGAFLGLFLGFDNYMYSVGLDYIPVSTSSLLFSTQLAFTAIFAFLIVKQKFTYYSINSVALMTLSAIVLALHTSSDRPPGVTNAHYFLGFFFTLGGAALLGLILPSIEFCYVKAGQEVTYTVVMQFQVVFSVSATVFCIVGMVINNDFQAISREGREYGLGEEKYYVVLVSSAIVWQFLSIGTLGVVYCSSSLFAGIVSAVLLPFTQVAAVIAFKEKFTGEKGMSLALCPWGFTSYFVGEYKRSKKMGPFPITEPEQVVNHGNV